jgi:hypothetical protein
MIGESEPFQQTVSSVLRNKDYSVIQNAKPVLLEWYLYAGRTVLQVTATMELFAQSRSHMEEEQVIHGFLEIR